MALDRPTRRRLRDTRKRQVQRSVGQALNSASIIEMAQFSRKVDAKNRRLCTLSAPSCYLSEVHLQGNHHHHDDWKSNFPTKQRLLNILRLWTKTASSCNVSNQPVTSRADSSYSLANHKLCIHRVSNNFSEQSQQSSVNIKPATSPYSKTKLSDNLNHHSQYSSYFWAIWVPISALNDYRAIYQI